MSDEQAERRWRAYQICQERGHQPDDIILTSNPPWNVCKHCGTYYRHETKLVESNTPEKPVRKEICGNCLQPVVYDRNSGTYLHQHGRWDDDNGYWCDKEHTQSAVVP